MNTSKKNLNQNINSWYYEEYYDNAGNEPFLIREAKEGGLAIATIHEWDEDERGGISREQAETNALLISSAPEMLALLRKTLKVLNEIPNKKTSNGSTYDLASSIQDVINNMRQ